jgi:hypothetical protein
MAAWLFFDPKFENDLSFNEADFNLWKTHRTLMKVQSSSFFTPPTSPLGKNAKKSILEFY